MHIGTPLSHNSAFATNLLKSIVFAFFFAFSYPFLSRSQKRSYLCPQKTSLAYGWKGHQPLPNYQKAVWGCGRPHVRLVFLFVLTNSNFFILSPFLSQHRHYFAFHALLGAACLQHRAALLRLQFRLQPPAPLLAVLACSASLRAVFGSACASFSVAAVLSSAVGSFSFSSLYIVFSKP